MYLLRSCSCSSLLCISLYSVLVLCSLAQKIRQRRPNIIVILADDLGWNDVGFHGSNEIPTPNIDALAYNGIILNRHYVLPVCTPSRASLMTGKYAIRTGLQGDPGMSSEPWALPLSETILPQYLKRYGYKTHLVGKWHLGFYRTEFTPTKRGFDSHFGYLNGWIRYNDSVTTSGKMIGKDARRNLAEAANEFHEKYATDVFTEEAVSIIEAHDANVPLFLTVSHVAVHSLRGNILQVQNETLVHQKYSYITNKDRRLLAGTLQQLDNSVGSIVNAMRRKDKAFLANSIILFMSDNGGATEDPHWNFQNFASNWPLRGMKTSLHEGAVRGAAAIWSNLFDKKHFVSNELFHISDWVPTFMAAAAAAAAATTAATTDEEGVETLENANLDGVNQWEYLTGSKKNTPRREVLLNVNHERHSSAIISENWKLIRCNDSYEATFADKYAGDSGREVNLRYDLESVLASETHVALSSDLQQEDAAALFWRIREAAKIDDKCEARIAAQDPLPNGTTYVPPCEGSCLYDIVEDPCEYANVAAENAQIVVRLAERLDYFQSVVSPQIRLASDERANPISWNGYWSPWMDEARQHHSNATLYRAAALLLVVTVFFVKILKRYSNWHLL